VLLEAPAQGWAELPEGGDGEGDSGRVQQGRDVDHLADDVVALVTDRPERPGDRRPEVRLGDQTALPAALGHRPVDGLLEGQQHLDAAIHLVFREHDQDAVAHELDDAPAGVLHRSGHLFVVGVDAIGELDVTDTLALAGEAGEVDEDDEQRGLGTDLWHGSPPSPFV
jgi:hypothetical protein